MWPYTERETDFLGPPRPRGELAARTLAMPADTNPSGDIFGGWIMSLMDSAGAITATPTPKGGSLPPRSATSRFCSPSRSAMSCAATPTSFASGAAR